MSETVRPTGPDDLTEIWDALEDVSAEFADVSRRKDRQLNLRVDDDLLARLRDAAAGAGEGYHTFARRLIEEGLSRIPERVEEMVEQQHPLRMKEVLLVLLGAGADPKTLAEPLVSRTRLQKLLFLASQHMQPHVRLRFEAYDYGPFDPSLETDVDFLASEGLIEATGHESLPDAGLIDSDRGRHIREWVTTRHSTDNVREEVESYQLTRLGMEWVRRFLQSDEYGRPDVKRRLYEECQALRRRFGRVPLEELVDYVYSEYPEFTARSKIRHKVSERVSRKKND
jgi:uncharacterized protein YwgA/predicted DNA binding CopG/RHH family protein